MAFVFSHTEYCDMHFVYGFCDGNACPAVEEYRRHFAARQFHIRVYFHVFTRQCMKRVVFQVSVCSLKGKRYLTLTYVRTFLREVQNFPLVDLPFISVCCTFRCGKLYMKNIYTLIMFRGFSILSQETLLIVWICATG